LGEKLRSKEIWVKGGDRYRNPAEDVPSDFNDKRELYYDALNLPMNGHEFVQRLKEQMRQALRELNKGLPANDAVEILSKGGGRIKVRPYQAQEEPTNLRYLKTDIKRRWWMTDLLDVLKEVDLRVAFSQSFASLTGQQRLSQDELQRRLLLCLFGLGTNTGLSNVSMGEHGISHSHLQYTRRRFISKEGLRHAIGRVVNATLAIKSAYIWGKAVHGLPLILSNLEHGAKTYVHNGTNAIVNQG
jgi:hypothetical protein